MKMKIGLAFLSLATVLYLISAYFDYLMFINPHHEVFTKTERFFGDIGKIKTKTQTLNLLINPALPLEIVATVFLVLACYFFKKKEFIPLILFLIPLAFLIELLIMVMV